MEMKEFSRRKQRFYLRSSKFWSISCARAVQSRSSRATLKAARLQSVSLEEQEEASDPPGSVRELREGPHRLDHHRFPWEDTGVITHASGGRGQRRTPGWAETGHLLRPGQNVGGRTDR